MSYKKIFKFLEANGWSHLETTKRRPGHVTKTLYKNNEKCILHCKIFLNKVTQVCRLYVYDKNELVKNEFNFINNYYWCSTASDEYFKKLIGGK